MLYSAVEVDEGVGSGRASDAAEKRTSARENRCRSAKALVPKEAATSSCTHPVLSMTLLSPLHVIGSTACGYLTKRIEPP